MSACYDEPGHVFDSSTCIQSVSKDVQGRLDVTATHINRCGDPPCVSLRTMSKLELKVRTEKCDSKLARELDGSIRVDKLATAYDTDGLHRGVHAGDAIWFGRHVEVMGRMSGITNAGLLRAPMLDQWNRHSQQLTNF